jgi:hypothetical protein
MLDMTIQDDKTIQDIQSEFNNKFPFLKIEFYGHEHGDHEGSPQSDKLSDAITIDQARTKKTEGDLSIHPNQKVSTLEQNFHDIYGLNVQVFRKSGTVWLQTIATDNWTLQKQNEKGAAAS